MQAKHEDFHRIGSDLKQLGMIAEASKWNEFEPVLDVDFSSFRVVAAGQQNSGKSTLMNVLCGRMDMDWFETADRIVTKTVKEMTHDGIVYVDTPGLGTTDKQDDLESVRASKGACVILFVHSCRLGELNADECGRLADLAKELEEPSKRIVVICGKSRDVGSGEKLDSIVARVREQSAAILGADAEVFAADSLNYAEGVKNNESELMEDSNLPRLFSWLGENRNAPNPAEKAFETLRAEIAKTLKERGKALDDYCAISSETKRKNALIDKLSAKWKGLISNVMEPPLKRFREAFDSLVSLKTNLKNL